MSDELRKKWRAFFEEHDRRYDVWKKSGFDPSKRPQHPSFPNELRGLTCRAKTRAGTPCKRRDLYLNGRCKLHGGLSTGPKTAEGKKQAALNGMRPKKKQTL